MEIDKLKLKDKPKINQIRFQAANVTGTAGAQKSETMILCTHYGLLIYEWNLMPEHMKKNDTAEEEEESKDVDDDGDENVLKIQYKLSVLPD